MVPAMAVVLLAAFVIYLFIPHDESVDPVKPVSYKVELDSARRAAPYPVLAPEGLSAKWRATSVRYEGGGADGRVWHLGFITPDTQYAAVEQSDARRPAKYIEDVTQGARRTADTVRVRGEEWTRYEGEKYDALVRRSAAGGSEGSEGSGDDGKAGRGGKAAGGRPYTTVVTGTASFEQLQKMAAALSPGAEGAEGRKDAGSGAGNAGKG
ncbi:hypothetical protein DB35_14710 [Streptomyces abyssalis]|uniref:DUF4245 domain-containing protein n=1 Tax=Streptomyces abyssalis TaxID=933944 RepID=A0A1E7JIJ6_9ACTN|nr:hypothetical protein AN215_23300 [Streptomyces abyssalis]OEU93373.1 hypothetical protein DB35_14710 [Streptomyces abyssalis]